MDIDLAPMGAAVDNAKAGFEVQSGLISNDPRLTPEGKAEMLAKADAEYRQKVDQLIGDAAGQIERAEARINNDLEAQRAALAQADIDAMGSAFVASLITRDLRILGENEIVQAVKSAPRHEWTQRTTLRLAIAELKERQRAGRFEAEIPLRELEQLAEPPTVAQLRKEQARLAAKRRELETWHPDYQAGVVARFGVR